MNDFLKTSLSVDAQPAWFDWDFSTPGGSCRKNPDGTVDDNASNVVFPFPKTNSEDQRFCSLYRPNASSPLIQRTTRKSVCLEDAAKAERSAQVSKDPLTALAYYQTALENFQEAGEVDGIRRVLTQMRTTYETMKNELGVEKTKGDLAFLDGKLDDALAAYRAVEKVLLDHNDELPKDTRDAVLLEMNVKISMTVQAKATLLRRDAAETYRKATQNHDTELQHDAIVKWRDAIDLMKEALYRTPSKPLTDGTLSLIIEARAAALATKTALDLEVLMLKGKGDRCHSNCHEGNSAMKLDEDPQFARLVDDKPSPTPGGFRELQTQQALAEFKTFTSPSDEPKVDPDQISIDFKKGLASDLKIKTDAFLEDIPAVVAAGLGEPANVDERIYKAKILAEAYVLVDDISKARGVYEKLIEELGKIQEEEKDPFEKKTVTLKLVEAKHQLASLYLHEYQTGKGSDRIADPSLTSKAANILDECMKALNAFDPSGNDDVSTKALQRTRAFLRVQGDLMRAEISYASAKTVDDLKFAEAILENSLFAEDVYLANVEKLPPNDPLRLTFAKAHERLAQLYYIHDPKRGDAYVELLLSSRSADKDLCSRIRLVKGMSRLTT
ncbi:MAG TPA: hypothetical protein VFX30_08600, partial [bacterium]|nr:hypothetical protein [bacterium]